MQEQKRHSRKTNTTKDLEDIIQYIPYRPLEYIQMPCSIKMHKIINIAFSKIIQNSSRYIQD